MSRDLQANWWIWKWCVCNRWIEWWLEKQMSDAFILSVNIKHTRLDIHKSMNIIGRFFYFHFLHRCNCVSCQFTTSCAQIPYLLAGLQRSWAASSCFRQKQNKNLKVLVKSSMGTQMFTPIPNLLPLTAVYRLQHLSTCSSTSIFSQGQNTWQWSLNLPVPLKFAKTPKWCEYRWMESQGPNSLSGQTDRVLKMKKETKGGERGSVFIRFMLSRSCWGVGEFPRTLELLSWEKPVFLDTDS